MLKNILKNKRGLSNSRVAGLIGMVIFISLVTALGANLFNWTIASAPTWVTTTGPLVVGAAIIMAIYRMAN